MELDPIQILMDILNRVHPALVPMVVITGPTVKATVDLLRRYVLKAVHGNVVQSVAAGVAMVVVAVQGFVTGMYGDGVTAQEAAGLVLVATINWLVALGFHNASQNRNKPAEPAG